MADEPDRGEPPFVETPFLAQGEAAPATPALFTGAFRWLVLAHGFSSFAFFAYLGAAFAEATYRFGASSSQLAVLGASLSVPFIFGALIQGLAVDRWSPKWLDLFGYAVTLSAIPVAWSASSIAWLWGSTFLLGAGFGMVEPSRSALTGLLVDGPRLVTANGTLATAFQLSLVLGSIGGGWLLNAWGYSAVYAVASGAAVLPIACLLMVPDVRQGGERPALTLADLRRGAGAAWSHPQLRILLLVTALGWTLINVFFVLEPLFVKGTLRLQGDALLYLWGAHGLGALAGAIAITRARNTAGREARLVCLGVVSIGAGILVYTGVGRYTVALGASAVSGLGFALLFPPLLALIQRMIPEDQRGRVTSVFVSMQESAGLASSIALLVLGDIVIVRPTLVGSGALLAAMGLVGFRAIVRLEAGRERTSA